MTSQNQSTAKNKILICPHIHWDREWFANEAVSQERLAEIMDQLLLFLENPAYPCILLDGQTGIVSDYLDVRASMADELIYQISQKKLKLGIWYYQPDLNIPNGESTIRNLLLGKQDLERYGQKTKIAYLPDSFGHFSQLPQILRGFGIEIYYLGRGLRNKEDELGPIFCWIAPDGSQILAYHLFPSFSCARGTGYDEKGNLNLEFVSSQVQKIILAQKEVNLSGIHLYMLRDPTPELLQIFQKIKQEFPNYLVEFTDLEDNFPEVQIVTEQEPIKGELRDGKYTCIFPGTYSCRINIKQTNSLTEAKLLNLLEPLCVFADWIGKAYPYDSLRTIWQLLIKNHFHDTICGTCVDIVYDEVNSRYKKINDISDYIIQDRLKFILEKNNVDNPFVLVVFNPHAYSTNSNISTEICLPVGWSNIPLELLDTSSLNKISPTILGYECKHQRDDLRFPLRDYISIQFLAENLPPYGLRFYKILPNKGLKVSNKKPSISTIKTQDYKVTINPNGSLNLILRSQNQKINNVGSFIDEADLGDLYSFVPSEDGTIQNSNNLAKKTQIDDEGPTLRISYTNHWEIPSYYDESIRARSSEKSVSIIDTHIALWKTRPCLEYTINIDNHSKDHRLSILIPTNIKTSFVSVLRQFGLEEKAIETEPPEGWIENPVPERLANGVIWLRNSNKSIAIITQGLYEFRPITDENGYIVIQLTLLRSVGWLSRPFLSTRSNPAGPCIPVPKAQMLGITRCRFALLFNEMNPTNIVRFAEIFQCPPIPFQPNLFDKLKPFQTPWRNFVEDFDTIPLDIGNPTLEDISFCSIEGDGLVTSCLKGAEDADGYILRVYNILDISTFLKVKFRYDFKFCLTRLDEQELEECLGRGKSLSFQLKPHSIISIRLSPIENTELLL